LRNASLVKDLARQRIDRLFRMAFESVGTRPDLSDRYVEMACNISRRTRVRIPRRWKRFVCRSCGSFLYPGVSARVRIREKRRGYLAVTCLRCKSLRRYPLAKRPASKGD